jgi:hypothetical protein
MELLRPFTEVKRLYLSRGLTLRVALALQEPFGAEVLPVLEAICLRRKSLKLAREPVERFTAARRFSGHYVGVGVC